MAIYVCVIVHDNWLSTYTAYSVHLWLRLSNNNYVLIHIMVARTHAYFYNLLSEHEGDPELRIHALNHSKMLALHASIET